MGKQYGKHNKIVKGISDIDIRRSRDPQPTKIERTGEKAINVHHDDGSVFECTTRDAALAKKLSKASQPGVKVSVGGLDFDKNGRIIGR